MRYEEMSSNELNAQVAISRNAPYAHYCGNPSDAWPIMDEYKIGLTFVNGLWRASSVLVGYHEHSSKNAFRAAMIVYLNMKGEK